MVMRTLQGYKSKLNPAEYLWYSYMDWYVESDWQVFIEQSRKYLWQLKFEDHETPFYIKAPKTFYNSDVWVGFLRQSPSPPNEYYYYVNELLFINNGVIDCFANMGGRDEQYQYESTKKFEMLRKLTFPW